MDVVELAKYLNQISETEYHYDNLSPKIQAAYQRKASWIIDFFISNGWAKLEGAKNTEQPLQPDILTDEG